jgi:hypothetical protein
MTDAIRAVACIGFVRPAIDVDHCLFVAGARECFGEISIVPPIRYEASLSCGVLPPSQTDLSVYPTAETSIILVWCGMSKLGNKEKEIGPTR